MHIELGPSTRPMKMNSAGGSSVFGSHSTKVDMEPSEEELVDYSSKFPEAMEEPKSRPEPSSYQEDDVPRIYCTEGTPRHISRASSAGDLSGVDKRRQPETIHEQDEVQLASHTATANATPQVWSRSSSPNSLSSYCMNGQPVDDAHSVISEFSRQPSGIISPSDLPDSPGQTMPPSPKDRRRNPTIYSSNSDQAKQFQTHPSLSTQQQNKFPDYGYHHVQTVHQPTSQLPQSNHFTPISINEEKLEVSNSISSVVRPHPEPRQIRSYTDSKMVGDPYMQEDSLHNYRTEDTPANLSAATSFSDLSSICPKSDYHGPVPRPRRRKPLTPLPDASQLSLGSSQPPELFNSITQSELMMQMNSGPSQLLQQSQQPLHRPKAEKNFEDQKSESSYSWKPRTLPRKVRQNPSMTDVDFANGNANKSMPDLLAAEDNQDSDSNSEDDELLRQVINRGRPARSKNTNTGVQSSQITQTTSRTQNNAKKDEDVDSDSESDNQDIIDELIKAGRPASRSQMTVRKSDVLFDVRDRGLQCAVDKTKEDRFKAARSMENLNTTPSRTVKKGSTNFRIREQPLRGAEGVIPRQNIARTQSMKSNKSLGYDQLNDRRQTKTPEPNKVVTRFDESSMQQMFHNKPVSKVSPMRSQIQNIQHPGPSTSSSIKKGGVTQLDCDDTFPKQVILTPVKSSVRQSSKTCLKRTSDVVPGEASESSEEEFPPRPPKPPQFRALPRPAGEAVEQQQPASSSPEAAADISVPDIITSISRTPESLDPVAHEDGEALASAPPVARPSEENNNQEDKTKVPPEPPEDSGDITVLSFKFTDSNRSYTRRFLKTNQFHNVVNYLQFKGFPPEKYKIVVSGAFLLKKEVTENWFSKTLAELKMVPKKTLTVKPR